MRKASGPRKPKPISSEERQRLIACLERNREVHVWAKERFQARADAGEPVYHKLVPLAQEQVEKFDRQIQEAKIGRSL